MEESPKVLQQTTTRVVDRTKVPTTNSWMLVLVAVEVDEVDIEDLTTEAEVHISLAVVEAYISVAVAEEPSTAIMADIPRDRMTETKWLRLW